MYTFCNFKGCRHQVLGQCSDIKYYKNIILSFTKINWCNLIQLQHVLLLKSSIKGASFLIDFFAFWVFCNKHYFKMLYCHFSLYADKNKLTDSTDFLKYILM